MTQNRGVSAEDICKKFPRVCKCPYKEDIDKDFQEGKTAYYVCKWLKDTEYSISYSALKKYYDYLVETGTLDLTVTPKPKPNKDEVDYEISLKLLDAIKSFNPDKASDNVKVQWILGVYKMLYGTSYQVDMNADVKSEVTTNLLEEIKQKRDDLNDLGKD